MFVAHQHDNRWGWWDRRDLDRSGATIYGNGLMNRPRRWVPGRGGQSV